MISYDSLYKIMYKALVESFGNSGLASNSGTYRTPVGAISVNPSGNFDIKPPSNKCWNIVNLYLNGKCDFKIIDNGTESFVTSFETADMLPLNAFITEKHYIRVTNTGTSDLKISYEANERNL